MLEAIIYSEVRLKMRSRRLAIIVLLLVIAILVLVFCAYSPSNRVERTSKTSDIIPVASTQNLKSEDTPWGLPKDGSSLHILTHIAFTIGYDSAKKEPRWVAYNIKSEYVGLPSLGKRNFKPDPDLPEEESAKDSDYKNSGYDRGHMAPFASVRRKNDPKPECESCYFSNICPQKPSLNRKIWELLEEKEREWAKKYGEVWVVTGPIFGENGQTLPSGRVAIPLSFYKIVARVDGEKVELLSFILSQDATSTAEDKKFVKFLVSVDEVEKATGLDFMSELPDDIENVLEAQKPPTI
jgi:endonuclease G